MEVQKSEKNPPLRRAVGGGIKHIRNLYRMGTKVFTVRIVIAELKFPTLLATVNENSSAAIMLQ